MKILKTFTFFLALTFGLVSCQDDRQARLYSEVRSVNKLQLSRMTVSKLATIDDLKLGEAENMKQALEALGDAMKVGKRVAAYSYDTYLTAYVDMSELSPEDVQVDEKARTITLNLPAIRTEYSGRDLGINEVHYRVTGLRSEIDPRERAGIKEMMNTALKKEVEEKPFFRDRLVSSAKAKAQTFFPALLGGGEEGYTVIVNFKE